MQQQVRAAFSSLVLGAIFSVTVCATTGTRWERASAASCTNVVDQLVVTQSTTFCPGTYRVMDRAGDGVIIVAADGITLDGSGLTLNGKNGSGYGVRLNGHNNVTIRNFNLTRFYYGLRIDAASGVTVTNNQLWSNGGSGAQFYDINRPLSAAYGGGILVNQTSNSTLTGNRAWDENVGFDMYASAQNLISDNDFSDNFGWGLRLYASTQNTIVGNRADHVHGCRGANCSARDTAGLLLVVGSHGNTIAGNSMVDGGDGFFIGNENGLPSNDNLVEDNDCSFAVHNAIETTFSHGNVFRGNVASDSAFGFWLGFSYASTVENNRIERNRVDGIHWEHGRFGTIGGNLIRANARHGLAFTLNPSNPLIPRYPGSEASHDHSVADNSLLDNGANGVWLQNTFDSSLQGNLLAGNAVNLVLEGGSTGNIATDNGLLCTSSSGRTCQLNARNDMPAGSDLAAELNWWGTEVASEIDALILDGHDDPARGMVDYDPWRQCGDGVCSVGEASACAADCGPPPPTESNCSNGLDDDGDGLTDCADADCAANPACLAPFCGDGTCDVGEGVCTCPDDCGAPPAVETMCSGGADDDCDGQVDCADSDCATDSACACLPSAASCTADAQCCSGKCRGSSGQRRCH